MEEFIIAHLISPTYSFSGDQRIHSVADSSTNTQLQLKLCEHASIGDGGSKLLQLKNKDATFCFL